MFQAKKPEIRHSVLFPFEREMRCKCTILWEVILVLYLEVIDCESTPNLLHRTD